MIATSSDWESEARRCFELADGSNIEYKMYYIARANTCAQLAQAAATLEAAEGPVITQTSSAEEFRQKVIAAQSSR